MIRPGPNLALLLLGSYRRLVDAAVLELKARGYEDVRPALHYAMSAIDLGASSATELGEALSVTKQAAAKTIALLAERGWVAVEDDAADRRRRRIRVTDLGYEVMHEGEAVFDDLRRSWADKLGEAELVRLKAQLTDFIGEETIRLDSPGWIPGSGETKGAR